MIIDQPSGTGFSFSTNPDSCAPKNEVESTAQLYTALQKIFGKILPQYSQNSLYLFGESFGGHYIPRIGNFIVNKNNGVAQESLFSDYPVKLNLKGLGIGNGYVDPESQNAVLPAFAYEHGLVDATGRDKLQRMADICVTQTHKYDALTRNGTHFIPANVGLDCDAVFSRLAAMTGINPYNVTSVHPYSFDLMARYLNQKSVRTALHISTATPDWVPGSPKVATDFEAGKENSMLYFLGNILNNSSVRLMVYGGALDSV